MIDIYKSYLCSCFSLDGKELLCLLLLVFCISGVIGFIYEIVFYYLNSGRKTWYMRGSNFLPSINIYTFGALLIFFSTFNFRNNPLLVFLISVLCTGVLEIITGLVLDKVFHKRLWDYSNEIMNFGNINGYICLRGLITFGICGLFLMYVVVPIIIYLI